MQRLNLILPNAICMFIETDGYFTLEEQTLFYQNFRRTLDEIEKRKEKQHQKTDSTTEQKPKDEKNEQGEEDEQVTRVEILKIYNFLL